MDNKLWRLSVRLGTRVALTLCQGHIDYSMIIIHDNLCQHAPFTFTPLSVCFFSEKFGYLRSYTIEFQ